MLGYDFEIGYGMIQGCFLVVGYGQRMSSAASSAGNRGGTEADQGYCSVSLKESGVYRDNE
jgi:hypothetical protein